MIIRCRAYKATMSVNVSFNQQTHAAPAGRSLFEVADALQIVVPSSCKRAGRCRECLVEVTEGGECLSAPGKEERGLPEGYRLACRARIVTEEGNVGVRSLQRGSFQIEVAAQGLLAEQGVAEPAVLRRDGRLYLGDVGCDDPGGPLHGVAVDVGTTTVALRILDLETHMEVASASFENPQRFGGTDVMARIQYDTEHPGRLLQRALLDELARVILRLPIDARTIYEYVVVGNSTMRDLVFGLDVSSIGQRPYRSLTEHEWRENRRTDTMLETTAKALRLPGHREARVLGLPLVSGHVGADAAACLLALRPHDREELVAIMDLGTNTELFLGNRERLLCASCPAGPAFEGRSITCGMPGLEGAIARIRIADDGKVETSVLGLKEPKGICGSGLIDLLSELRRTERMNHLGRLEDAEEFVVDRRHGIVLRESDINELAQAKAANVAGLVLVAQAYGCNWSDVSKLYLAGGFGRHIDVAAARAIGLVPDLPVERIVTVGNAALEGAVRALLSVRRRQELVELVGRIEHIELERDPSFFDHFVNGCQFVPIGSAPEVKA
jgi:uncharacterized 2Fe-2S/4Fe-4S cluster protein (DUF4445 family)